MKLFGLEIVRKKETQPLSVVSPSNDDGSTVVSSDFSGYFAQVMELEAKIKNETDLIRRYREISMYSDCDAAIDDICNEAIIIEEDKPAVAINLDALKVSDVVKKKIRTEFDHILYLLKFKTNGHDIFRTWYIDGRIYFHVVVDEKNPNDGIMELRQIDPRKIRKIKDIKKRRTDKGIEIISDINEYYLYNDKGISETAIQGIKLPVDSVVYATSGLVDANTQMTLSYLHRSIKLVNQLKMLEDAVVVYRITRAPERRIFYIDVGNLPKIKAEQYVNDMMNKLKNKITYNPQTGETTDARNHLCLAMDTKIPLLDGRTLTLEEITHEYNEGKSLWAYSCDPISGAFAPGLITWAGVTRPNAKVIKITLDNNESIICTPEHSFPVWNKGLIEAKDLIIGESMIPFYKRMNKMANTQFDYEQIFENEKKKWIFTHRLVSQWKDNNYINNEFIFNEKYSDRPMTTVHHKNFKKCDNSPENLVRMSRADHIAYHSNNGEIYGKIGAKRCKELGVGIFAMSYEQRFNACSNAGKNGGKVSKENGKSYENFAKGREIFKILMEDESYNNWFREQQRKGWTDELKAQQKENAKKNNLYKLGQAALKLRWQTQEKRDDHYAQYAVEYLPEQFECLEFCAKNGFTAFETAQYINQNVSIEKWKDLNKNKVGTQKNWDIGVSWREINKICKLFSEMTWNDYKKSIQTNISYKNHKIINIEYLDEPQDTGCLTIDGNEIYHKHHTFALAAGIYTKNSMMEDFFLPRRGTTNSGTEITTLPGLQNVNALDDLQYFQNKLFQSLNVPISRLKGDSGFNLGRASEITRDEIKFNKFITRIRSKFCKLFIDALKVQLILKNIINPDDWDEIVEFIRFDFMRDNFFAELKENEILTGRINILQAIDQYVGKYFTMSQINRDVLRRTDEDIELMEEDWEKDREFEILMAQHNARLAQIQQQFNPTPEPEEQQDDQNNDQNNEQQPDETQQ